MTTLVNGVQTQAHVHDMILRVERRQELLDQILVASPDISVEELTKKLSEIEQSP